MKKYILFAIITLSAFLCNAQMIGEWTAHTPGMKVISVDVMRDKIYAATPYDIFYYNTNDNSINRMSKVNGLSDMGVSFVKYGKNYDILFVGYSNTNIDIIDNQGNITNIPDIYNKYILGNKTINDVFFHEHYAYVCCSFGIVVIDLERNEVKDTYIIGNNGTYLNVNDLTILDNLFYAATASGIYYARVDNPYLADFSQWKRFSSNLPTSTRNFSQIECFNNYIVANYSDNQHDADTLYAISDTTTWNYFLNGSQFLINDLRAFDDRLVLTENLRRIKVYDTNKNLIFSVSEVEPNSATYDKTRNFYWAGSNSNSLVKIYPDSSIENIILNGPFTEKVFTINASDNDIWVAAGGYTSTWAKTWNRNGFSRYDGTSWSYKSKKNHHLFDSISDITCVKTDPRNSNIFYAASYDKGLLVFENDEFKTLYSHYNSSLSEHSLLPGYTYVTGFDFDSKNNMWLANTGSEKMLSVWKTDGTWQAYNIGGGDIGTIMVDRNDIKWIFKREGSLIVFDGNTTKTVSTSANTGNLPGAAICFVTDNKGTVWIGTTDGVALFYDSKKIFKNNTYSCSRILIPRNDGSGQADYLLSGQSVLSIAVDGANNLWFGTNNGVIHTSNDGLTEYHHFTTDNSPLFSNSVKDIAIDNDGNVYFATDNGIISYKGEATKGNSSNTNVLVYPNPVRPEHQGIVGIKGLVTNALVKITTTSGAFVTHLRAQGGQAVWDCTDIHGNKVEPGIYLIFVSDDNGSETYATKVLIMK